MKSAKDQALNLISSLSEEVTWEEVLSYLHVRHKIEEGIKAADEGRVLSHDEVKHLFARPE
jgi:predicted transcriptional regulator